MGEGPLGRPIAGTAASVSALSRQQVARFYRRHYRASQTVVAVAGNVEHTAVVRQVRKAFGRNGFLASHEAPSVPRAGSRVRRVHAGTSTAQRPFEQVNVVIGVNGITRHDERRYALGVLNAALGGSTSSRLFQEVRERRGLAYSIYSFAAHHADAGLVGVAVGCLPGRTEEVLATVRAELARVAESGITQEELERGQGQLRAGLVLGLEDSGARMTRLGKAELVYDELLPVDEILARVDAVTADDVRAIAHTLFTQPEILAVVGPSAG